MTRFASLLPLIALLALATPASAQTTTFELTPGAPLPAGLQGGAGVVGGSTPALDETGLLMLQAMQQAQQGDYKGAEGVYSSIIQRDGMNMDAHLHRGILRRELGNESGSQADAKAVVNIANNLLSQNPRNAEAYHTRGMAFRLLKQYPQALKDIQTSLSLGGDVDWKTDLRDTALEEKVSQGVAQ